MAIWGIFLNTTLRAAAHLGQDYDADLRYVQNQQGTDATWMSTSLLCEKAYQITNAKTCVFSDSVFCVGKVGGDPVATWKSKIKWYSENIHFKHLNRIDAMPKEFEWKTFPGITTFGLLEKIQSLMADLQCEPEHFTASRRRS